MATAPPSLITRTKLEIFQLAKLFQHIRNSDKDEIERLVQSGIPNLLNYRDEKTGETALSLTAAANQEELVEFLLGLGAHPDVVDAYGRSAIMRAAAYGHIESVTVLAAAGADLRLQDSSGRGVLFYCSTVGGRHIKCAEVCIQFGADVNCTTYDGVPVLVVACESANDCLQTCMLLIEKGADPTSMDKRTHRTALMAACRAGSAPAVRELLYRGADVNAVMLPTCTNAAHDAAMSGQLEVLQALSAYRVNLDQLDQEANNPLHYAAERGHSLCCRFLGQRGCNPKVKNAAGRTARMLAKEKKYKAAAKECRRAEAAFGKPIKNGESWALAMYDFTCIQYDQLLNLFTKFDVDSTGALFTEDFLDVLQSAGAPFPDDDSTRKLLRMHENEKFINYKEFLSAKKYINRRFQLNSYEKNKKKKAKGGRAGGKTKIPLVVCTQDERKEEVANQELTRVVHSTDVSRYSADRRPEHELEDDSSWYNHRDDHRSETVAEFVKVSGAVRFRDLLSLQNALNNGELEINGRDRYYKTPLMHACMKGDIHMVKYLCEHGADVNAVDNFKWTPLHFACHCGIVDVVEYLLDLGATVGARALNGCTPLMRAIQSNNQQIVQMLLDRGAKLRVENNKGHSPMTMAEAFAEYPVYSLVKTKWDSLPPIKDKRGNQPSGGTQRSSTRQTTAVSAVTPRPVTSAEGRRSVSEETSVQVIDTIPPPDILPPLLPFSDPIGGKVNAEEDITYFLLDTWKAQKTSKEIIDEFRERRSRFGWESDFSDFRLPFYRSVLNKVSATANVSS